MDRLAFVNAELEVVHEKYTKLPGVTEISCLPVMTQYKIHKTPHKELTVCIQFPDEYPNEPLIVELKTKVLAYKLMTGLTDVVEKEAKKYLGNRQVMTVLKFIHQFLDDNPLCVCSEEISKIKNELITENDKIILKQKTSQVIVKFKEQAYYLNARLTVPDKYPDDLLKVEITGNNFCESFHINFTTQANEIARQAIEAPLKKNPKAPPFVPKPSLYPVINYLSTEIVKRYPREICPVCKEKALPENPEDVEKDPEAAKFVYRLYCSHLFHFGCLDHYMKQPPFEGGKKCPTCKNGIFHNKWRTPPQIAEARWAHKEARARELDEVVDFLNS